MKLFAHPGASSLSVHILLRETELPFDLEVVNIANKTRAFGGDYLAVNPRGLVPALELDDGTILTENAVIAQYICDLAARSDLMPPSGTMQRYKVMEWQSFVSAELHKAISPLFWPIDDDTKTFVKKRLAVKYSVVESALTASSYLTGEQFTAADAYLFPVLSWALFFKLDLSDFPGIRAFLKKVGTRPSVAAALAAEGPGFVSILGE